MQIIIKKKKKMRERENNDSKANKYADRTVTCPPLESLSMNSAWKRVDKRRANYRVPIGGQGNRRVYRCTRELNRRRKSRTRRGDPKPAIRNEFSAFVISIILLPVDKESRRWNTVSVGLTKIQSGSFDRRKMDLVIFTGVLGG